MARIRDLGPGRRDSHAGQAKADGDRGGDGVAVLQVDEIHLGVGGRGRFAGQGERRSRKHHRESNSDFSHRRVLM